MNFPDADFCKTDILSDHVHMALACPEQDDAELQPIPQARTKRHSTSRGLWERIELHIAGSSEKLTLSVFSYSSKTKMSYCTVRTDQSKVKTIKRGAELIEE